MLTCAGDSQCRIALFGNVCGHADMNWESVRAALCALYGDNAQTESAARLPDARDVVSEQTKSTPEAANAVTATKAGERLGIDLSLPWPDAAEPLRSLFQTGEVLTEAPDDQCVYVAAPMPEESGFPYVAAGVLVTGGALAAIRYALPAAWSEEAPAGLEDYAWVGDQNRGWWVTEVPVEN